MVTRQLLRRCHGVSQPSRAVTPFFGLSWPLCNGHGRDTYNCYTGITLREISSRCLPFPLRRVTADFLYYDLDNSLETSPLLSISFATRLSTLKTIEARILKLKLEENDPLFNVEYAAIQFFNVENPLLNVVNPLANEEKINVNVKNINKLEQYNNLILRIQGQFNESVIFNPKKTFLANNVLYYFVMDNRVAFGPVFKKVNITESSYELYDHYYRNLPYKEVMLMVFLIYGRVTMEHRVLDSPNSDCCLGHG
ncbi:Protein PAL-1, isoform c [Corchorus olitorius]|uniref:Protein PAL-1, isoform c n=1 Tax=Corchorus olitorius TaxID=93759 RepID=A0A1R3KPF4_9ROSI|nr:Protein PAL-1, isoform c [Corchorus olitorius]